MVDVRLSTVALVLLVALVNTVIATTPSDWILDASRSMHPWLVSVRRELHSIPELMFELNKTSDYIRRGLDELGIPYKYPYAQSGIVATLGSGKPVVALRADMDALPVDEPEGLEFISQHPGNMHACGHDAHMTMLLGAAKLLKAKESELKGTVKLLFQPAEEGGAGGEIMVEEGAMEGVDAVFGMHVMPTVPTGQLAMRAGPIMAGTLSYRITVQGQGGHAAMPHLNVDPIVAAAGLVSALQTLVSRETNPLGSAVVSVTMLRAGEAYNVIPDQVMLGGTIRALTHQSLMHLKSRMEAMCPALVAAYGCSAEVDWRLEEQPYYPPTVNDAATVGFARKVAEGLLGAANVLETDPLMAGEDFAFLAQAAPGAFMFLGVRNDTVGSVWPLHSPKFRVDEEALQLGAALHTALAINYLDQHHTKKDEL